MRGLKPCFVGTRIARYDVLEYLAGARTMAEIVHYFPELTEDHVRAAIEFSADHCPGRAGFPWTVRRPRRWTAEGSQNFKLVPFDAILPGSGWTFGS